MEWKTWSVHFDMEETEKPVQSQRKKRRQRRQEGRLEEVNQ